MNLHDIFFIIMTIIVIGYIIYTIRQQKRIHLLVELFFLGIYFIVLLIFMYPKILTIIETNLGFDSAINFIIYLSIFISYLILFILYIKSEEQRKEITKLNQEIAFLKSKNKK